MTSPSDGRKFSTLLSIIAGEGGGSFAYKAYADRARQEALYADAAAWLLLATVAEHFADQHYEEPFYIEESRLEMAQLERLSAILDAHYASANAAEHLRGINAAALDILHAATTGREART